MKNFLIMFVIPISVNLIIILFLSRNEVYKRINLWWAMPVVLLLLLSISAYVRNNRFVGTPQPVKMNSDSYQILYICIGMVLWGAMRFIIGYQKIKVSKICDTDKVAEFKKLGKRNFAVGALYFVCSGWIFVIYNVIVPYLWS